MGGACSSELGGDALGEGEVEGGEEAQEGHDAHGDGKGAAQACEDEEHHEVALVALAHAVPDLHSRNAHSYH